MGPMSVRAPLVVVLGLYAAVAGADAAVPGEGWLSCSTTPWARVFVDGKDTGRVTPVAPRAHIPLAAGRHVVTFVVGGRRKLDFPITVKAGEEVRLVRELAPGEPPSALILITKTGQLLYGDTEVSRARLVELIRQEFAALDQLRVVIAADRAAPYGTVMGVLDGLRAIGVAKVALAADKP